MSKNKPPEEPKEQQPREPFGHPFARKPQPQYSEHKPGYEDSPAPRKPAAGRREEAEIGALLPPRKAEKLPRVSLVEKLRKRLEKEEGKK